MPRAITPSLLGLAAALGLGTLGCDARKGGTETASAATNDSTSTGGRAANAGAIPLSTSDQDARRLYLEARSKSEQLRAHDARELYEQAAAKDPTFALAHYQLAINSATAKDFFAHLKEAAALADKASEGERLMILALEAGGNAEPKKALEYLQELVATYPNDERAHFLLGGALIGQQEYDKAIEQYRRTIEINPDFSPAYNSLGYAYRPLEKYADAETAFKKYIELIPGDPNPYDSYAELLMKMGRFEESKTQYRKALEVDPHFTPSKVGLATNLMLQGRHDQAAAEMDRLYQAARDDGDRRTALFVKGVIRADQGATDAAVKEIEREYTLDAHLADTANMSGDALLIGNILLAAGRLDPAAKRFQQALDLVEHSSLSDEVKADTRLADHYNRGRVALARGDLATARTAADAYAQGADARHNAFRSRQAHELAGQIALAQKDYDGALRELEQANQQDPAVTYAIALAYRGKGDARAAQEWAGKAANANILPLASYAFIRAEARKLAAG
jgi:tetratricopeptide (TPR) repeat protein